MVRVAYDGEFEELLETLCRKEIVSQDFFAGQMLQDKYFTVPLERSEQPVQIRLRPFAVQLQDIFEIGSAGSRDMYEEGIVFGKQRHVFELTDYFEIGFKILFSKVLRGFLL